jgi:hypothetical protein
MDEYNLSRKKQRQHTNILLNSNQHFYTFFCLIAAEDQSRKKNKQIRTSVFIIFVRMDAKLTLKLEKAVIEDAKNYAASKNFSLSRLIESYLKSLTSKDMGDSIAISPFVKSLSTGVTLTLDLDEKEAYRNYLAEKHK